MKRSPQKQHVWPEFVAAVGLLAFGFYFALGTGPRSPTPQGPGLPEPFLPAISRVETAANADAVHRFARTQEAQRYRIDLRQQQERGGALMRTRLALRVTESKVDVVGDRWSFQRSYDEVELGLATESGPIGLEVCNEVARLVETAVHRVETRATGDVTEVVMTSAEAAQLRQALELIEQGLGLLAVRLPREGVRTGEPWAWEVPASATSASGHAIRVSGNTRLSARVVGAAGDDVFLALTLVGETVLELREATAAPHQVEATGAGEGFAVWNVGTGRLNSSEIRWQQTAQVDGETVTTSSSFSLAGE